jgi:hypothetical protein
MVLSTNRSGVIAVLLIIYVIGIIQIEDIQKMPKAQSILSALPVSIALQHYHYSIAGFTITGFVSGSRSRLKTDCIFSITNIGFERLGQVLQSVILCRSLDYRMCLGVRH